MNDTCIARNSNMVSNPRIKLGLYTLANHEADGQKHSYGTHN